MSVNEIFCLHNINEVAVKNNISPQKLCSHYSGEYRKDVNSFHGDSFFRIRSNIVLSWWLKCHSCKYIGPKLQYLHTSDICTRYEMIQTFNIRTQKGSLEFYYLVYSYLKNNCLFPLLLVENSCCKAKKNPSGGALLPSALFF